MALHTYVDLSRSPVLHLQANHYQAVGRIDMYVMGDEVAARCVHASSTSLLQSCSRVCLKLCRAFSWLTALEPLCMHEMLPETPHVTATLPLETVPIPFAMK